VVNREGVDGVETLLISSSASGDDDVGVSTASECRVAPEKRGSHEGKGNDDVL
jgi:hypothetical protein